MEHYQDLKLWLQSKGSYADGVALYQILGNNNYYKTTLFARPQSAFLYDKLAAELQLIFNNFTPVFQVPVIVTPPVQAAKLPPAPPKPSGLSTHAFFSLPQPLQAARLSISQLFAEAVRLRRQVKHRLNLPPALGTITLQEAFYIMGQITKQKKGVPFNMVWLTYNAQTGKGGEVLQHDCLLKFGNKTASRYHSPSANQTDHRNPNHDIHGTCNVQIINTIEIRKLHTWLIFRVNNYDVVIGEH